MKIFSRLFSLAFLGLLAFSVTNGNYNLTEFLSYFTIAISLVILPVGVTLLVLCIAFDSGSSETKKKIFSDSDSLDQFKKGLTAYNWLVSLPVSLLKVGLFIYSGFSFTATLYLFAIIISMQIHRAMHARYKEFEALTK